MDIVNSIVAELDAHIETLQSARSALLGTTNTKHRGRPKKAIAAKPKKRMLSEEARKKISAAVKKRWATQKKAVAAK